jgi:hypothetical protein
MEKSMARLHAHQRPRAVAKAAGPPVWVGNGAGKAKGCGPAKGYDLCEDGDWLLVGQSFHRCRAIHCRDPRDPPCTGMLEVSRRNLMLRPSYVTACDPEIQGNEGVKGRLLRWS